MSRLVFFLSATALAQALLFSALAPMLPMFQEDLDLSKGQAGLLMAVFSGGQVAAVLPVGLLAARVGMKPFAIAGLTLLAVTSVAFGLAQGYWELLATRAFQGAAAAICWSSGLAWIVAAAPRHNRGEMIGLFSAAAAAGQVIGPAVGALAVPAGHASVFTGIAILAMLLALSGARLAAPTKGEPQSLALLRKAHRSREVMSGHWLVGLSTLLLGTVFVLAPLQLDRLGWGSAAISATFVAAAIVGVVARPRVGRWADRLGLADALRLLVLAPVPAILAIPWLRSPWALAVCVVAAVGSSGVLFGPAMALASQGYEDAGTAQVLGFALLAVTLGVGLFVGAALGGEIAHVAGDATAYTLGAGICLSTFLALALHRQPPSTALT